MTMFRQWKHSCKNWVLQHFQGLSICFQTITFTLKWFILIPQESNHHNFLLESIFILLFIFYHYLLFIYLPVFVDEATGSFSLIHASSSSTSWRNRLSLSASWSFALRARRGAWGGRWEVMLSTSWEKDIRWSCFVNIKFKTNSGVNLGLLWLSATEFSFWQYYIVKKHMIMESDILDDSTVVLRWLLSLVVTVVRRLTGVKLGALILIILY